MYIWRQFLFCFLVYLPSVVTLVGCASSHPTSNTDSKSSVSDSEITQKPMFRIDNGMHTAPIYRIATDRKGQWAVTASSDKTARVWNISSGKQITVLRPPQGEKEEGELYSTALAPDGTTVALAGWTGRDWQDGQSSIYLFNRTDGRMLHRIQGLPGVNINHLAYSPDGQLLVACLGIPNGIRLFAAKTGIETDRDEHYFADASNAHFSPDGTRLVTTSADGNVRLYSLNANRLNLLETKTYAKMVNNVKINNDIGAARFDPVSSRIAVGFNDSNEILILDATSLAVIARPSIKGGPNKYISSVTWSTDGKLLLVGGYNGYTGNNFIHRLRTKDWGKVGDTPLASNVITDLVSLPDGSVLYTTGDPSWGVINGQGHIILSKNAASPEGFRDQRDILDLSKDGRQVRFNYPYADKVPLTFDLSDRNLNANDSDLDPACTKNSRLKIKNWKDHTNPSINGHLLELDYREISRSLALAPNNQGFVLGTKWNLYLFDKSGKKIWKNPVPCGVWAVNISRNGQLVVAAYGDGTIRWHQINDGKETLAFFPYNDSKRWAAWTPEGFYTTSDSDAEELIGYHLNQGPDREGLFISAGRFRERLYQPELISHRFDADGEDLLTKALQELGDVRQMLNGSQALPLTLELLSDPEVVSNGEVTVRVRQPDLGRGFGQLRCRIDGTTLEGRPAGIPTGGIESRTFSLPPGKHKITVAAIDERGVESAPVRITAEVRKDSMAKPDLYLLAVGVTHYRDKGFEDGVRYAAADALAMCDLFQYQKDQLYQKVKTIILTDQHANSEAIVASIALIAQEMKPQDVFVLYLAGHGISHEREYHFIPWDAVYTSGEALRARSLTGEQIRKALNNMSVTKTLVLLDTCGSGTFARLGLVGRGGFSDKDAIDRLGRLTGRWIIAATADEKMALEGEGGHGVFTYTLLEGLGGKAGGMNSNTIEVGELADFVEKELPKITKKKWKYEQFPYRTTEGNSFPLFHKL